MSTPEQTSQPPGLVLFVSRDAAAAARLKPALADHSVDMEAFTSLDALAPWLAAEARPVAGVPAATLVLVDREGLEGPAQIGALASTLRARSGPVIALACLARPTDIAYRLAALRARVTDCLDPAADPAELAARLAVRLGRDDPRPGRVLIVDDQPVAALFAARVLESAGMHTERVGDPLAVLDALERFQPDLVLMDLRMPGASGIELTGIIRGQERFVDLPILFLSGELDPDVQMQALRVGADDFLAKPASPERLVAAVRGRLERSRRTARGRAPGAGVDPDTGLASRERFLKVLDRHIGPGRDRDRGIVYLECPEAGPDLYALAALVAAQAGPDGLAARVGERGIAVLAPLSGQGALAGLAADLDRAVRLRPPADGATGDGPAAAGHVGIGWCPLSASGGEAVTLVSRARQAARTSLRECQGRPMGYVRGPQALPGVGPGAGVAPARERGPEQVQARKPHPILAAIEADRIQLLYQPMLALHAVAAERYEATPRLRTPDGELLAPGLFAPAAVRAGLMQRLDRWVLEAALDAVAACREAGRSVELFIHQSLASMADDAWVARVREAISGRDLIRMRPVLQLQVGDADRHPGLAVQRAGQLARLGIRLCLNGFAEGERGERVLDALPVAYVRLAAEAVRTLPEERLKSLAALARSRGALVVATGVDGPKTIERLYRIAVELIQGPYVQPPAERMDFDFQGAVTSP